MVELATAARELGSARSTLVDYQLDVELFWDFAMASSVRMLCGAQTGSMMNRLNFEWWGCVMLPAFSFGVRDST